ncbi:MAG: hypothetical protein ACJA13_000694 [Paraglaciecola sp.]|jgi:hypothetical protein
MLVRKHCLILASKGIWQSSRLLFWIVLVSLPCISMAQDQTPRINKAGTAYDCTQVSLDAIGDELLTTDERIGLLDKSLTRSIDNYSACIDNVQQQISSKSSSLGLGDGVEGAKENAPEELVSATEQILNTNTSKPEENVFENIQTKTAHPPRRIIPPTDNDQIICKILFEEIAKTTDANMLKGLKKQYENYKCG